MRHRVRVPFARGLPCHVTLKMRSDVPSLRNVKLVREFERTFARGCERGEFRVVHYSLQHDHAHLVVEASDRSALGRGMKSVGARLARAVNRVFDRRGQVLADRYHLHVLKTPSEVRNALRYVLLNARKHVRRPPRDAALDPASSARWFDGWRGGPSVAQRPQPPGAPVSRARGWLLRVGWKRRGLLDPADVPGQR